MATIKSQMTLNDGMSAVLKKITSALDTTLSSFEQVQRASGQAIDVANIQQARAQLAEASRDVDQLADNYHQAAQEEEKLNQGIRQGTSAADGMLKKVLALAGAYVSMSSVKNFVTDAMSAADTQINAQVQLRTVLNNMGAEEAWADTQQMITGTELESTMTLDTTGALESYEALAGEISGDVITSTLTVNTGQAMTAYDAILDKAAEIQSRGIYGDEAMIAGAAEFATYFSDAEAIMSMMDTLSNYAMGMSGGGAIDSTAMVDYATNLGKIMSGSYDAMTKKGFEFTDAQKAIIEGTATEAQIVEALGEEYLNCSSDMQAAAAINSIIEESWGGLYETMSATPEGQIIQFNNTLGDLKEEIGAGLYPAVLDFMNVFQENLPMIQELGWGLVTVIGSIIEGITMAANGALEFAGFVQDNWSVISPIVYGIVAALAAYAVISGIVAVINGVHAASEGVKAAAQMMATGATFAETAAQYGLNAALMACPITWIVVLVLAFVAALVALCNWIAKTTGLAQSGFGIICGGINVAVAAVKNAFLVVANVFIGIWNAAGAVCSNIGTAFHNVIANVQGWFYGLLSTALTVVEGICAALNKLPFVEFDYSGITAKANEYAAKSAEAYGSTEDYTSVADAFSEGFNTFDAFSEGWAADAFQAGANWGDGVADKVGNFMDGLTDGFNFEPGTINGFADQAMGAGGFALDDMAGDVGDIAKNTGKSADSLEITGEELKYLRDIAERDAINRFTTAEVKIDMTGMTNRIEGGADLDGVIRELTDGFTEALVTAAEGVHA